MSDLMSDFLHRFMDEECMYGVRAIEFCSGWGRNKYFVLLHHYRTVDLMDRDAKMIQLAKNFASLLALTQLKDAAVAVY